MTETIILNDLIDYKSALQLQLDSHEKRSNGEIGDRFFILEHYPVFTLGYRGGRENLLVSEKFLNEKGISVEKSGRGGNITYHGPGQLVVYPIIDISKIGVKEYITRLEQIGINIGKAFSVDTSRNDLNRGVWYKNRKIASVGVAVKKGVTLHGLALNVNTDLEPFSWINPCGLPDVTAVGLNEILDREIDMNSVKEVVYREIREQFPECFDGTY